MMRAKPRTGKRRMRAARITHADTGAFVACQVGGKIG
jgi:hypothetical protein